MSILVTIAAMGIGYFLDPSAVFSSIVASLILVGPSAVVSGFVISHYKSIINRKNDLVLLGVCLKELLQIVDLTEDLISKLYKGNASSRVDLWELISSQSRYENALDPFLRFLEELRIRLEFAADFSPLDRTDEKPWLAEDDLFNFPDFPLIATSLNSLPSRERYPWTRLISGGASRWYESVPMQLTTFSFERSISVMHLGIERTRAEAYLQRVAGSGYSVVQPMEYLANVREALMRSKYIMGHLRDENNLPRKYLSAVLVISGMHQEEVRSG